MIEYERFRGQLPRSEGARPADAAREGAPKPPITPPRIERLGAIAEVTTQFAGTFTP